MNIDYQGVTLFLFDNEKFYSHRIPAAIITNFDNSSKVLFETFSWSCCENPFHNWKNFELRNDSVISLLNLHIPRRLKRVQEFSRPVQYKIQSAGILKASYSEQKREILRNRTIEIESEINAIIHYSLVYENHAWHLITIPLKTRVYHKDEDFVIGWYKED